MWVCKSYNISILWKINFEIKLEAAKLTALLENYFPFYNFSSTHSNNMNKEINIYKNLKMNSNDITIRVNFLVI